MKSLPNRLLTGLLLLVALFPLTSRAQVRPHPLTKGTEGVSLPELTARATAIFEGKAVAYRSFWNKDHSIVYTVAAVDVYKVFKGAVAGTVEVATLGGTMPDGAMGLDYGAVPIGNYPTGVFFALPFHDDAYTPAVPAAQVYQVVSGHEGLFLYSGLPPEPNAADTPYLRYAHVETTLYPLPEQYTGAKPRVLKPFDVSRYDRIKERRGQHPQLPGTGTGSTNQKKRRPTPLSTH